MKTYQLTTDGGPNCLIHCADDVDPVQAALDTMTQEGFADGDVAADDAGWCDGEIRFTRAGRADGYTCASLVAVTEPVKLTKGKRYNVRSLKCVDWRGDDTGLNCWDYFDADGIYLGPDADGVEPLFVVR